MGAPHRQETQQVQHIGADVALESVKGGNHNEMRQAHHLSSLNRHFMNFFARAWMQKANFQETAPHSNFNAM